MPAVTPKPVRRRVPAARPAGTSERILQAALAAFAEHGFDGASTRDIARAAGVNQGLITYHYGDKEKLWRAAVDDLFARLATEFEAPMRLLGEVDPPTRLRMTVRHFVRFSAAHPELHRLIVQEGKRDGARLRWLVDRHIRPLFEIGRDTIAAVQQAGLLPADVSPAHLHYLFLGAAAHVFVVAPEFRRLTGEDPTEPAGVEAHADALVALLLGSARR